MPRPTVTAFAELVEERKMLYKVILIISMLIMATVAAPIPQFQVGLFGKILRNTKRSNIQTRVYIEGLNLNFLTP